MPTAGETVAASVASVSETSSGVRESAIGLTTVSVNSSSTGEDEEESAPVVTEPAIGVSPMPKKVSPTYVRRSRVPGWY